MEKIIINHKVIYRFESIFVGSNMYLIVSDDKALIIDPHFDLEAEEILTSNKVKKITVFLTHEHPDHTEGIPWLKEKYTVSVICQKHCAEAIAETRNNRSYLISFVLAHNDVKNGTNLFSEYEKNVRPYSIIADFVFEEETLFNWENQAFYFKHTPGHSPGGCCISTTSGIIFTGDSLIYDIPVITRFPGGNLDDYQKVTIPYLKKISSKTLVLPGHGKIFTMEQNHL